MAQSVKNPPASARDTRDAASIPGPGRSPGEGNGKSGIYRIPFSVGLSVVFSLLALQKLERKKRRKRTREWEGEEAKGSGVEEEEPVLSKL